MSKHILLAGLEDEIKYSREEFEAMTEEKKEYLFQQRVDMLKKRFKVEDRQPDTTILSYDELATIHRYGMSHFEYTSDMVAYGKSDFWDMEVFRRILICGILRDDCESLGITMLQMAYWVFGERKDRMYMVACAAETGEGHFVSWHQADDGIYYQIENRVRKPRTVRYMRDIVGYTYWDYASLTEPRNWRNAEQKVMRILYDTPVNTRADKAEFSIAKALKIDKSKTLLKEWSGVAISAVAIAAPAIQQNHQYLATLFNTKTVAIIMLLSSIVGIYIRTITDKDIDNKRSMNE